jgi:hypothetical protein
VTAPIVETIDLTKVFPMSGGPVAALRGVSLRIEEGDSSGPRHDSVITTSWRGAETLESA